MAVFKPAPTVHRSKMGSSHPQAAAVPAQVAKDERRFDSMKRKANLPHRPKASTAPSDKIDDDASNLTASHTFTPEYRNLLCQKTVKLMVRRDILNKKISRASQKKHGSSKSPPKHLLDRQARLQKREQKHLSVRTKALLELGKQYKLHPSPERAKDIRLINELLQQFKRHLKANSMDVRRSKKLRLSPLKSDNSSIASDADDSLFKDGPDVHDITTVTTPEKSDSEKASRTKRKRSTSLLSNEPLSPKDTKESSLAAKKTKKTKLDNTDHRKKAVAASSTSPLVNGDRKEVFTARGALQPEKAALSKGEKNGKKHPLEGESDKHKSKKAKIDESSSKSSLVMTKPRGYYEQRQNDMLNDPLGFDDFVYDDTRPKHKRPKFRRFGFRHQKPDPNFSPMMSGGLGLSKEDTRSASKLRLGSHSRDRLSDNVLKKNHNKKVTDTVKGMKAKVKSSSMETLTDKSKYSVSKEDRYAKTNGAGGKVGINGTQQQQRKNQKTVGRLQQQSARQQYSISAYSEVPTMTSAISPESGYEDPVPRPSMTPKIVVMATTSNKQSKSPRTPTKVINGMPEKDRAWFKQERCTGPPRKLEVFYSIPSDYHLAKAKAQVSNRDYDQDDQPLSSPSAGKSKKDKKHHATADIEADTAPARGPPASDIRAPVVSPTVKTPAAVSSFSPDKANPTAEQDLSKNNGTDLDRGLDLVCIITPSCAAGGNDAVDSQQQQPPPSKKTNAEG